MGLVSLTSVLVSGAIPLTPLLPSVHNSLLHGHIAHMRSISDEALHILLPVDLGEPR